MPGLNSTNVTNPIDENKNLRQDVEKDKRIHYTLETKKEAIRKAKLCKNISEVGRSMNIDRRLIGAWIKNESKINESDHCRQRFNVQQKNRKGLFPELEEQLFNWIMQLRNENKCLNGGLLKSHALELYR